MRHYVGSRSICQRHVRVRACLSPMHVGWGCHRLRRKFSGNPTRLMPPTSSPAPPAGTAPPSLVLLRHPRRRLGYPRAHVGRPIFIECLLSNPTVQVFQRFQGARVRHEKKRWPLRGRKEIGNAAIAAQNSSPGFTEPTLPRKRSWQVSALFRPRPGRTRQLCRPLHSAALIRFGERRCGSHLRGAFRCVPTAANRRDRPEIGRTQRNNSKMSRGFARHEPAIARDASHGQDTAIGREAPPGQDNRH